MTAIVFLALIVIGSTVVLLGLLSRANRRSRNSDFVSLKKDINVMLQKAQEERKTFNQLLLEAENFAEDFKKRMTEIRNLEASVNKFKSDLEKIENEINNAAHNLYPLVEDFKRALNEVALEMQARTKELMSEKSRLLLKSQVGYLENSTNKTSRTLKDNRNFVSEPLASSEKTTIRIPRNQIRESQNFDIMVEKVSTLNDSEFSRGISRTDPRLGVLGAR